MKRRLNTRVLLLSWVALAALGATARAQEPTSTTTTVVCVSAGGERQHCPADTSAGVVLSRATGSATCLLGRNWGYDGAGVWVTEGCGGEFLVRRSPTEAAPAPAPAAPAPVAPAPAAPAPAAPAPPYTAAAPTPAPPAADEPTTRIESWGEFEPGDGFLVGRNKSGELAIGGYGLLRYVNQLADEDTFTDHLGNEHPIDDRQDFFPHRAMVFFKGWVGDPKLIYHIFIWTVNTTDQDALFGVLGYQFDRKFSLYGGINGFPGTRSLQGSHPYWLGHDRVMADEFFRPYFSYGVWAQGEVLPGLWYNAMVGNNLSSLGIKAVDLDRKLGGGASMWWMPTTHEFGPRGAFGDWENHEDLATRFGVSSTWSTENRQTSATTGASNNTTIKLADSLNLFDTGSLANGVTVQEAKYEVLAVDAGVKCRGFFLQAELYTRWLDSFVADGPLPVAELEDQGFYVQAAFYPLPKKLELYAATSQIYGDEEAGFDDSSEYVLGLNFYPADTRNHRLNIQVQDVNDSPVGSTFGYYVGGLDGTIVSSAFSVYF